MLPTLPSSGPGCSTFPVLSGLSELNSPRMGVGDVSDVHTPEQRSFNMSRIRGKDTSPELIVRSLVHRLGYRFRLHVKALPGCPDLVFPRLHKAVFVHGCFWHSHSCKYGQVVPRTNGEFWTNKRAATIVRDEKNRQLLRKSGWKILTIWECRTGAEDRLAARLKRFLQE
jgi:DNA mismatch endonuclease, patch repair protein